MFTTIMDRFELGDRAASSYAFQAYLVQHYRYAFVDRLTFGHMR